MIHSADQLIEILLIGPCKSHQPVRVADWYEGKQFNGSRVRRFGPICRGGHSRRSRVAEVAKPGPLISDKEERPVVSVIARQDDWPSDGAAELVAFELIAALVRLRAVGEE